MKRLVVALMLVALVPACGSMRGNSQPGLTPAQNTATPVKDVRLSTDFTDQGVKIVYTLTGSLERIEVVGTAPAWRGNVAIVAEADAMDKLVKFVHGQTVSSERRNKIVTKTLDRARDNTLNQFKTVDGTMNFDAREVEREVKADVPATGAAREKQERDNTSRRIADRVEEGLVEATTIITAQGRLVGVRKISDRVIEDGRTYVAVYQWSPRDQDASDLVRSRMR